MLRPVYTRQMYMWACTLQVFAALKTIFQILAFSHQQKNQDVFSIFQNNLTHFIPFFLRQHHHLQDK